MSVLFFDLGNTRIKWRHQDVIGTVPYEGMEGALNRLPVWRSQGLEVVFASVVKDQRRERFLQSMKAQGAQLQECLVASHALGVSCAYKDFTRLGIDRWLAILAAWVRYRSPVLVVDLGTAVTMDFVGRAGEHLGGYILPGLKLAIESLLAGTCDVRVASDRLADASRVPGRSTAEAVYNGALAAMTATVEGSLAQLKESFPEARLVLTGGDGARIAANLHCDYELADQLIFEGMSLLHANKLTVSMPYWGEE